MDKLVTTDDHNLKKKVTMDDGRGLCFSPPMDTHNKQMEMGSQHHL